jgi:DNA-directed RNA polymerase specialized sigma24 family protein
MRNKHLSQRKMATIIYCFCEDITALSAAAIVGVNRNTVNSYYQLIREAIFRQSL